MSDGTIPKASRIAFFTSVKPFTNVGIKPVPSAVKDSTNFALSSVIAFTPFDKVLKSVPVVYLTVATTPPQRLKAPLTPSKYLFTSSYQLDVSSIIFWKSMCQESAAILLSVLNAVEYKLEYCAS
jgi:hypothetical protein